MATNDELDDFFKRKDRKGNKNKKQSGLLTNNQELFKQLEIVTSATSAFKDNDNFDDDDEQPIDDESIVGTGLSQNPRKNLTKQNKMKIPDNHKYKDEHENKPEQDQQNEEWDDFESLSEKYEQLRLKFIRANDGDEKDYSYDDNDDENNFNNNDHNERRGDYEQQKDKPVWKIDQIKQTDEPTTSIIVEKVEEQSKSSTTSGGAYRPPALRKGTGVTIVSGLNQRPLKGKQPNLASTDEFPTLGTAVNKK